MGRKHVNLDDLYPRPERLCTKKIHISDHAIERFKERVTNRRTKPEIYSRLLEFFGKSKEVKLQGKFATFAVINHNVRNDKREMARYFRYGEWIMVVVGNELKTIHRDDRSRWK